MGVFMCGGSESREVDNVLLLWAY